MVLELLPLCNFPLTEIMELNFFPAHVIALLYTLLCAFPLATAPGHPSYQHRQGCRSIADRCVPLPAFLVAQMAKTLPAMQEIPWRRAWQPTLAFLPGEFCGERSLAGYCLCGCKGSDITEQLTLDPLAPFLAVSCGQQ